MSISMPGGVSGLGNAVNTTLSQSFSTTNNSQTTQQAPQGNVLSGSSMFDLVVGSGANIAAGGIQVSVPPDQSIAAMGTIATQALTNADGEIRGAETGLLSYASKEQSDAFNLARQATPMNTGQILMILGGIAVGGLFLWEYTKHHA